MNRLFIAWLAVFFSCAFPLFAEDSAPPPALKPAEPVVTNDWSALSLEELQAEQERLEKDLLAQMQALQKARADLTQARQQGWQDPAIQPFKDEMAAQRKRTEVAIDELPAVKEKREIEATNTGLVQGAMKKQTAIRQLVAKKIRLESSSIPEATPAVKTITQPAGAP